MPVSLSESNNWRPSLRRNFGWVTVNVLDLLVIDDADGQDQMKSSGAVALAIQVESVTEGGE